MSNLDRNIIIDLLKSEFEVNHELAFQMLEGSGVIPDIEIAKLLTSKPDYLFRCFRNNWRKLLGFVKELNFRYQDIPELPGNIAPNSDR